MVIAIFVFGVFDDPEPPATNPSPSINSSANAPQNNWSVEQQNALEQAYSYLALTGFSADGLVEQLVFEKYPQDVAIWAVSHCEVDWNAEALEKACSYVSLSGFSRAGLIEQLKFEKFTPSQAVYGADNCGADWNAEAAEKAASYLSLSSFSREGLIDQLKFEGFTADQAEYAVKANGFN